MADKPTRSVPSPPASSPTPVTVLGGYLGAGKTTILNQLLAAAGTWTPPQRIAVLVNDFGDINIDADLIESDDGDMISLSNGCICCSLVDGFAGALEQIRSLGVQPDRLVIETSGVADPASVAAYAHTPGFTLDGVIVAADVETIRSKADDKYVGQTVRSQLAAADLVVVTKVDLVERPEAAEVREWIGNQSEASVVTAANGSVPVEALFGLVDLDSPSHSLSNAAASPPEAADQFVSASWSGGAITRDVLDRLLASLPAGVVRLKGVVAVVDEGQHVVQVVGDRQVVSASVADSKPGTSRLAVVAVIESAADDVTNLDHWLADALS